MILHTTASHWDRYSRSWSLLGQPLRPTAEDVRIAENTLRSFSGGQRPDALRALLLGVTPEIADMDWPPATRLTAADREPGMIAGVWPGDTPLRSALCADWLALPFAAGSFDFVIGDGCLVLLDYPAGYRRFAESIRNCIVPDGMLMLRVFCRPEQPEQLDDIREALHLHAIGSFDALKLRLLAAVHRDDIARGVALADAWHAWQKLAPDPTGFAREQGWPLSRVRMIDAYRDNPARYYFPSQDEVCSAFSPVFEMISVCRGHYELAERCPHLLFRPSHG